MVVQGRGRGAKCSLVWGGWCCFLYSPTLAPCLLLLSLLWASPLLAVEQAGVESPSPSPAEVAPESLLQEPRQGHPITFSDDDLPTDDSNPDTLVIHKCCPESKVFDHATNTCQPSQDLTFSVPIFTVDYYGMYMESNLTRDQVKLQTEMLGCERYLLDVIPDKKPEFDFRVLDTGQLWVPEYEKYYDPSNYCLENFVANASVKGSSHIQGAMVCVLETEVETFDPTKIPVRKCCMHNEVYDTTISCTLRANVTDAPWLVPFKSAQVPSADVHLVDVRQPPYSQTHELVPNFQTCVGDQMGWQVDAFHLEEETGGLFVPHLDRVIPENQYCIEDFHTNGTLVPMAYVCVSVAEKQHLQLLQTPGCQTESCVPKCCQLGEIIDAASSNCVSAREFVFTPSVWHENNTHSMLAGADYGYGFPECEVQLTYPQERVQLLERGSLRYVSNNTDECEPEQVFTIPRGEFCIDQVLYSTGEVKQGAGFCFSEKWDHLGKMEKQQVNYIYSAFLAISDLFILVSFIVYLTVPDQNKRGLNKNVKLAHSVLGRILLCFLFSLFFAYLFLIIIKLFSDPINLACPSACIGVGVCMYMFFMATFFWLNVLCFELWWKCARQESSSGRRWVWYQVYAWVSPMVFGAVSLMMEFTPSISNCYIKPKFGTYSCFFSYTVTHNNGAKWAYFFGPVAVLLMADLLFFILTVRSLLVTVQQSHKGTVQKQTRQRLRLCFKLFLVMGISWLAEIISFQLGPSTVWYISDVFNCFQGFIIFLIFILKPKILEAVRARLCGCCGSPPPAKPRGTNAFSSVVLSNSASTDEFSLSNQQLSFAHIHAHNRLSLSHSQNQLPLPLPPSRVHKQLSLSYSRSSQPHPGLENQSSNSFAKQLRPQVEPGPPPTSATSSPASSRPSTPRTNSTRASLSASCKSVDEAAC
ncbi:uncharacterized protein LOC121856551 isoform X1 [Homarus americanus]|uniref:uncharacterized protein LOC121856551 isoform X1 n=1 Tax=Homarus americanus TaxID=6706 RepID=UPI001C461CBC|nr:uncharacterized protein LOC121856551 isoform X1 [Homarus americanus]